MKVLLVNVNASTGSTGKIVTDIKSELEAQGHECLIAYGANETHERPGYYRICSANERRINAACARLTGILYGCSLSMPFNRLKRLIDGWKPDIVNLHCANGYILNIFKTLEYLAKNNIPTIITNHAEFFYTGGCGHAYDCLQWQTGCRGNCKEIHSLFPILKPAKYMWRRFKAIFDNFNSSKIIVSSVSPWVMHRAMQSPILARFRNRMVLNGLDTNIFCYTESDESVKSRLPKDKPIILHVAAQFTTEPSNKGGDWICKLAVLFPDVNIIVAASYIGKIDNLPSNIIIWGKTKDQKELSMLYSMANLTVITSYRETFSMVTAESLCCGTPVVGFKAGGPESIALPEYSKFVEHGDLLALEREVRNFFFMQLEKNKVACESHAIYSKEVMADNYIKIYNELLVEA